MYDSRAGTRAPSSPQRGAPVRLKSTRRHAAQVNNLIPNSQLPATQFPDGSPPRSLGCLNVVAPRWPPTSLTKFLKYWPPHTKAKSGTPKLQVVHYLLIVNLFTTCADCSKVCLRQSELELPSPWLLALRRPQAPKSPTIPPSNLRLRTCSYIMSTATDHKVPMNPGKILSLGIPHQGLSKITTAYLQLCTTASRTSQSRPVSFS